MPQGVEVYVEGGFATIDFVDRSLRGQGIAKLIEVGGPASIETLSRSGPRRQYRVPEGNAREAGLLDTPAEGKAPNRVDLGSAEALATASPEGARPEQPTSLNAFSQSVRAGEYRTGVLEEATLEPPLQEVLGHTSPATTVSPAEDPQSAVTRPHSELVTAAPTPVRVDGSGPPAWSVEAQQANGTLAPTEAPAESPWGSAPTADPRWPEGEPQEEWTRKQLDAYAANVRSLDTSDRGEYPTKADVVKALQA